MSLLNDVFRRGVRRAARKSYPDSDKFKTDAELAEKAIVTASSKGDAANTAGMLPNNVKLLPASQLLKNENGAKVFCVGSVDGDWSEASGNSCTWVVPEGATVAEFQVWGAGGNGSGCSGGCCGWGPGGLSGEYTRVRMSVTPGESYLICAGGGIATTMNSCYNYCDCSGCNSFVCNSNNGTSILSCGGLTGFGLFCGSKARAFPSVSHAGAAAGSANFQTTADQCTGLHFGVPGYYNDGNSQGKVTTNNDMYSMDKVPSMSWGTKACGSSICYACTFTYSVGPNHQICKPTSGWTGNMGGCCMTTRMPGLGGMGAIYTCNINVLYGSCGNSGLVVVSYK